MSREGAEPAPKALGWMVSKASAALSLRLSRAFSSSGIDLNPEQYGVLSAVSKRKDPSQADVARTLGRDGPSVTRLVDGLERSGSLERERREGDRRAYKLVMTDKGKADLAAADRIVEREERFLRDCLPAAAIPVLESSLTRIMKACSGE